MQPSYYRVVSVRITWAVYLVGLWIPIALEQDFRWDVYCLSRFLAASLGSDIATAYSFFNVVSEPLLLSSQTKPPFYFSTRAINFASLRRCGSSLSLSLFAFGLSVSNADAEGRPWNYYSPQILHSHSVTLSDCHTKKTNKSKKCQNRIRDKLQMSHSHEVTLSSKKDKKS
jgi:hypothetical protein